MARPKTPPGSLPSHMWTEYDSVPPPIRDILTQAAHFFDRLGYTTTFSALLKEATQNGVHIDVEAWEKGLDISKSVTLMAMWESWREQEDGYPHFPPENLVENEPFPKKQPLLTPAGLQPESESGNESSSDDSSSESEEDETEGKKAGMVDDEAESTSDDSSDESSSEDEVEEDAKVGAKRKRAATPESSEASSDESSSESSDDEEEGPPAKRAKTVEAARAGDSSSEASSSESDDESEAAGGVDVKMADAEAAVSSSGSSSDTSSSSESASASSSSDSSSSDSESSASPPPKKKAKKTNKAAKELTKMTAATKDANDSSSSATLAPGSPTKPDASHPGKTTTSEAFLLVPTEKLDALEGKPTGPDAGEMHPDRLKRMAPTSSAQKIRDRAANNDRNDMKKIPATEENVNKMKKGNVPFSRIPKDTVVDKKFASNEYVSYEYADKAYQDLSVTKGKGFTKEKNKKKRGAYRGGAIDFTPKGIKFDD